MLSLNARREHVSEPLELSFVPYLLIQSEPFIGWIVCYGATNHHICGLSNSPFRLRDLCIQYTKASKLILIEKSGREKEIKIVRSRTRNSFENSFLRRALVVLRGRRGFVVRAIELSSFGSVKIPWLGLPELSAQPGRRREGSAGPQWSSNEGPIEANRLPGLS